MFSGFLEFGKGWFLILQTLKGHVSIPFYAQRTFYVFAHTLPPSNHFSLFSLKSDAQEFSCWCCWVPGLPGLEVQPVKWARKNRVPTLWEKQPSLNPPGKTEDVNANKYYEVNVSGHSFLGMGLSEIRERAGSEGFIFEKQDLDLVLKKITEKQNQSSVWTVLAVSPRAQLWQEGPLSSY